MEIQKMQLHSISVFGIMIPVAIALIPLFQIYSRSNLLNTRTCLIITYIAFGLSLSIYLVQGYLRSFPDDIMEAAVIDGCGYLQTDVAYCNTTYEELYC